MVAFSNSYTSVVLGNQNYMNAIAAAEQFISSNWTNPITINVKWDSQNAGTSAFLASNSFSTFGFSYAQVRSALVAHANNPDAQAAIATLPGSDPTGSHTWSLPVAYARMLGLTNSVGNPDDTVTLNTSYNWSYNGDVTGALIHELSEGGMGRIGGLGDQNGAWSTMDLFRYSSPGVRDFQDGRDGKTTYFSADGSTLLLPYNNQYNGSSHVNTGDTADFNSFDVFGFGNPGNPAPFSSTDFKVMNVLGWTPVSIGPPVFAAAGDYNSNGLPDFIWRRTSTAQMAMWEYNPTAQTVTSSTISNGVDSNWGIFSSGHFSGSSTSQMLMDYGPQGLMTLWWVSNGQLTGFSLGQRWINVGYLTTGQFLTTNVTAGINDFLVTNATDRHIYDWWINAQNQLTGIDITATSGVSWVGLGLVTVGQFTAHGGTNMLVTNTSDHHLYDWWLTGTSLQGVDLGPYWANVALVSQGQFTANAGTNLLVTNAIDHHLYNWWITAQNQLTGIDLTASSGVPWAGVQLVTSGRFDSNTTNTELLVQNPADHHLYEWWITAQNKLTGIDLGAAWAGVQLIGNSHYNNNSANNELLVRNTNDGHFYEWWISGNALHGVDLGAVAGSSGGDPAAGMVGSAGGFDPTNMPSLATGIPDGSGGGMSAGATAGSVLDGGGMSVTSSSLMAQAMASFGAGNGVVASTGALAGTGPVQEPQIAAATDPRFAHAG